MTLTSARTQIAGVRVSVIMPCYRAGAFLCEAIDSVFAQNMQGTELIIVVQGEEPLEEHCLRKHAQRGDIQIVRREKKNAASARNSGLALASGDYVAFLDADDVWSPNFLSRAVQKAVSENIDCVFGETVLTDDNLNPIGARLSAQINFASFLDFEACPIHINSVVVRRQVVKEIGGFDDDMNHGEDWDFLQRLTRTGRVLIKAPGAQACYRIHSAGTTADYAHHTRELIDNTGQRVFSEDPLCETAIPEYRLGMGSAHFELAMLPRRFRVSLLSVLTGKPPQPLAVPTSLFLHWYAQDGKLESLVRDTISRYHREPFAVARRRVKCHAKALAWVFEQQLTDCDRFRDLGLTSPETRIHRALGPEILDDLRRIFDKLKKGLRKYFPASLPSHQQVDH